MEMPGERMDPCENGGPGGIKGRGVPGSGITRMGFLGNGYLDKLQSRIGGPREAETEGNEVPWLGSQGNGHARDGQWLGGPMGHSFFPGCLRFWA